jgi:hypothetical protein
LPTRGFVAKFDGRFAYCHDREIAFAKSPQMRLAPP